MAGEGGSGATETDPAAGGGALRRTVALVGLMGSGKSAVGRRLAARLSAPFCDSDTLVEERAGMPITRIFAEQGEDAFRALERESVADVLRLPPTVLATGGGAWLCPTTRARLRRTAATLWLRASVDLLVRRCGRSDRRPLLRGRDLPATLERLVAERYPVYAEADLVLDCADRPLAATEELALCLLREHGVVAGAAPQ